MGAERRALAMAAVSACLMVSGAAVAAAPGSPAVATAAYANVVRPVVTASVPPSVSANLGVPHPTPVIPTSSAVLHAEHKRHEAAMVTTVTPAPVVTQPSAPVATVTTITPSPMPTTTSPAPAPSPIVTHTTPPPTSAPPTTTAPPSSSVGAALLSKALTMQGVPYVYGGDTPSGFDCSGLVYWAALQIGISSMPRDTFGMLAQGVASGLLVQTSYPSYGDLAFFGSGHVEFYVHAGETFGAQNSGTLVGYHSYGSGYVPTMFFRIT